MFINHSGAGRPHEPRKSVALVSPLWGPQVEASANRFWRAFPDGVSDEFLRARKVY